MVAIELEKDPPRMEEIEKRLKEFLDGRFAGFSRGTGEVDEASRRTLLHACDLACAESCAAGVFREVKCNSPDWPAFFRNLSARGSATEYERLDAGTIRAMYNHYGCDLVWVGPGQSRALRECSAANLRENLPQALDIPVSVEVETSILRGGKRCVLIAPLNLEPRIG
jgi:hypothetical protein